MKHIVVISKDKLFCWIFAFLICTAEILLSFQNIYISFIIYLFIFLSSLIIASFKYPQPSYSLYLSLALIPLIRIISVSIPLSGMPGVFEFIVVSIPLFITGVIVAKMVGLTYTDLGFKFDSLHNKLLIGFLGILLGFVKYLLFRPGKTDISTAPEGLLTLVIILIFLGFLEEFLFRGIIYIVLLRELSPKKAVYFTSFLYATLTISSKSFVNVIFAFLMSIILCRLFTRQKSLTGLYIVHGLMNITLYVIYPLIFNSWY